MNKDKKKRIIDLAKAGGDDADLILLENIEDLEDQFENIGDIVDEKLSPISEEFEKIKEFTGGHIEQVKKVTEDILANVKGKDGVDGLDGKDGKDGRDGRDGRDGTDGVDGKDADEVNIEEISTMVLADVMSQLPETPEIVLDTPDQIIDKVNTATNKIKRNKVEGIDELEQRITYATSLPVTTNFFNGLRGKNLNIVGGTATQSGDTVSVTVDSGGGHTIQDEGSDLTQRTYLNFVGAGVTVTDDSGNDATKVTISGGGAGTTTVETPTGTVNSVNDTFTVTNEPLWVVADGITYFDGAGYSYSALTLTMDVPPSSYIRSVY